MPRRSTGPAAALRRRGDIVRRRRLACGLSQVDIAEVLGLSSRSAISEIEGGTRDLSLTEGIVLARLLQCDIMELAPDV